MDHERLMSRAIFTDIFEGETRRQIEIKLYRRELPRPSDSVDQLDVDFRAVESGLACDGLVRNIHALHRLGKGRGGAMPILGLTGVILRMRGIPIGKFDLKFVEAKIFHDGVRKVDASLDFGFDLRRHAEDVRVVLREASNAHQSVQYAAAFIAINGAEFR